MKVRVCCTYVPKTCTGRMEACRCLSASVDVRVLCVHAGSIHRAEQRDALGSLQVVQRSRGGMKM